jgi:glycosyltransferase involved in cell wall biosynthesis
VQEAAASGVTVVASHLVLLVVEFLLGDDVVEIAQDGGSGQTVHQGAGAIVVQVDDVRGFAQALECLPANGGLRVTMAERAYRATIAHLTRKRMTSCILTDIVVSHD